MSKFETRKCIGVSVVGSVGVPTMDQHGPSSGIRYPGTCVGRKGIKRPPKPCEGHRPSTILLLYFFSVRMFVKDAGGDNLDLLAIVHLDETLCTLPSRKLSGFAL